MTLEGKKVLERRLKEAKDEFKKQNLAIGSAAGEEYDWHDNAAFDIAVANRDVASSRIRELKQKLQNVEIIKPREETNEVGIGNEVVVRYNKEKEDKVFTIVGPVDSELHEGWISHKTPLGKSLLGAEVGEFVEMKLGDGMVARIKVKEIKKMNVFVEI